MFRGIVCLATTSKTSLPFSCMAHIITSYRKQEDFYQSVSTLFTILLFVPEILLICYTVAFINTTRSCKVKYNDEKKLVFNYSEDPSTLAVVREKKICHIWRRPIKLLSLTFPHMNCSHFIRNLKHE